MWITAIASRSNSADITVSNCSQLTDPGDLKSFPTIGTCRCTDADITHSDAKVSGGRNE
ncbi:MAG: hypothetical protein IPI30_12335 [Saprospiraceae bacterium]|nr:hypothetical protein [Candidatus Vicinibacter affinis]